MFRQYSYLTEKIIFRKLFITGGACTTMTFINEPPSKPVEKQNSTDYKADPQKDRDDSTGQKTT